MSFLRKITGDTIIYGVSSLGGRIFNYLLITPYLTRKFQADVYATHGIMYSFAAILLVILSYRMETAFFRFGSEKGQKDLAFTTASLSILVSTIFIAPLLILFSGPIAGWLTDPGDGRLVIYFVLITVFDVLAAMPFAKLRLDDQPKRFAILKIINIFLSILLTLLFLEGLPWLQRSGWTWFDSWFRADRLMDYVFMANILASAILLLILMPAYFKVSWRFDRVLWKKMLIYAWPLILVGVAAFINQFLDRIMIKHYLGLAESGIYNGAIKIAILMNLFAQAYNYASEPFFFNHADHKDSRLIYAKSAQAFTLVASWVMVGILVYIDLIQYLIGSDYRSGLSIIPITLTAYLLLGVYYSFSIWYKLGDKTYLGAYIALAGSVITILVNMWLLPRIGFMGSAYAALACFVFMTLVSYALGQKYFAIPYAIGRMCLYLALAWVLYLISRWVYSWVPSFSLRLVLATVLFISFPAAWWFFDRKNLLALIRF